MPYNIQVISNICLIFQVYGSAYSN